LSATGGSGEIEVEEQTPDASSSDNEKVISDEKATDEVR